MLIDQSPLDVELSDPDVSVEFSEVLKYLEVECSTPDEFNMFLRTAHHIIREHTDSSRKDYNRVLKEIIDVIADE